MSRSTYDFSTKRLIVHVILFFLTGGVWLFLGPLWEWYRYNKK